MMSKGTGRKLAMALSLAQYTLAQSSNSLPGASSYVAPAGFPTTAFSTYYPVPSGQEPQPVLVDPVLNITFPLNLTDPNTIPDVDNDPVYYPKPIANLTSSEQEKLISNATHEIAQILTGQSSNCTKCKAALEVAQYVAQRAPTKLPAAMVDFCVSTGFASKSSCSEDYAATNLGASWVQVLAFANVTGLDGDYICNHLSSSFCPYPAVSPLNISEWFPSPKPADAAARVPKASGKRIKVAQLSDVHLDPRYDIGSEGNCTSSLCCRSNVVNKNIPNGTISYPAPPFGYYECDCPYDLALAAFQSVGPLTGTNNENPLAWTIYTGDLVSHDPQSQLSRAYVEYAEDSIFEMLSEYLTGPVFPVLGNHDTNPVDTNAPHSLPGSLGTQMSWNYDHVSKLWQQHGWIDDAGASQASLHYGAYSIKNHYGLRMITLNTDFWYHSNIFNFINTSNPDVSGSLKFIIDELQAAEDAGERVWIFGHVLSGWDGSNPLVNPTNLFYQIVDRYSPHVIANIFWGHTHEDELMIYYANNATVQSRDTALMSGWTGPSVTPLTNLNSGYRLYSVDSGNFEIYDAYTYYANVNVFPALENTSHGPTFKFEYSTREAYGPAANWPADAPLNATFWHAVTEAMENSTSLVSQYNTYQGKMSVLTPNCTNTECQAAKICYMRSGSAALGKACPAGYGSVQSAFDPK